MDESTPTKMCAECGLRKPVSAFGNRASAPDGRRKQCNECRNARRRALRAMSDADRKQEKEDRAAQRISSLVEKRCPSCGLTKSAAEFGLRSERPGTLRAYCFECDRLRGRQFHAANRAKRNAAAKKWRQENPDTFKESYTRWAKENPEKAREARKRWYAANRDKAAALRKEFHERNPEYRRLYYERNRDKFAEYTRRYYERYPELVKQRLKRRRAASAGAAISDVELMELWTGACGICGGPLDVEVAWPHPESKSLDHIVPLARGGEHSRQNLQWSHLVCNMRKGDRII